MKEFENYKQTYEPTLFKGEQEKKLINDIYKQYELSLIKKDQSDLSTDTSETSD